MESFLKLPNELIMHILSLCTARDILSSGATCKRLANLIKGSSELQLIIELAVHGLRLRNFPVSTQYGHLREYTNKQSASSALSGFHKATQAWQALRPFTTASIPLERYEYEIGEGMFGHALKDETERFRGLEFQRLWIDEEGDDPDKECLTWRRYEDFGMNLADFSFDLSEDLLVIVEDPPGQPNPHTRIPKNVKLLSLADNTPHPLAKEASLGSPGLEPWYQCDIKICGSILAIFFAYPHQVAGNHGRLTVWNWKTGVELLTVGGVGGYAFLSPKVVIALLVASVDGGSAEEYNMRMTMELEIYSLDKFLDSEPGDAQSRLTLSLPLATLPEGVYFFSDKPLADSPNFPPDIRITPYTLDETAERIIVIQFLPWNHYVFLSTRRLLRLLDDPVSSASSEAIPWGAWGMDTAFWMSAYHLQCGYTSVLGGKFCAISGYQRLFSTDAEGILVKGEMDMTQCNVGGAGEGEGEGEEGSRMQMLILDFNQRPIIRRRARLEAEGGQGGDSEGATAGGGGGGGGGRIRREWDFNRSDSDDDDDDDDDGADAEKESRRQGNIDAYEGIYGMSGGGTIGEWACFSPHLDGMVVTRLPFRAFQREDVQGYLDWIVGMDHLIGIPKEPKHTYDVMQFAEG